MALPYDPFKTTLLPLFFGIVVLLALFGMSCVQAMIYLDRYPNDDRRLRLLALVIFFLGFCDCLNTALSAYLHFVTGWGDPSSPLQLNGSQLATAFVESVAVLPVQLFFAWRLYTLTSSRILSLAVAVFASLATVAAFAFGIAIQFVQSLTDVVKLRPLLGLWYSSLLIADLFVTVSLLHHFRTSRTGFPAMEAFNSAMMSMAIQTGMIPTIFAALTLVFYLPGIQALGSIYIAFILPGTGLYVNAFFAVLNSRPSRSVVHRRTSFSDLALPDLSPKPATPTSAVSPLKASFGPGGAGTAMLHQPVSIAVMQHHLEYSDSSPAGPEPDLRRSTSEASTAGAGGKRSSHSAASAVEV